MTTKELHSILEKSISMSSGEEANPALILEMLKQELGQVYNKTAE
ncbi:hypothetical protein [Falsibacillus pallidus]